MSPEQKAQEAIAAAKRAIELAFASLPVADALAFAKEALALTLDHLKKAKASHTQPTSN